MGGLRVYMVNFDTAIPLFTFTFSFKGGGGKRAHYFHLADL